MIKGMGIIGGNYQVAKGGFPIVSPLDIAEVAAAALIALNFTGHQIQYIASDEVSTDEIAATLGAAIGKPDLAWVTFTSEMALGGMLQAGLPEEMAKNYVEMNESIRSGQMFEDYFKTKPHNLGKIKLSDFAKTFAAVYQS